MVCRDSPFWAIFVCYVWSHMRIPEELLPIVNESVNTCGARVIDLVMRGDPRRPVVEIYVDAEGAVTTELCSDISRKIAAGIDAGGFLASTYRLEVSSPGIDRPLKFEWQYRKHIGRDLRMKVQVPGEAPREVLGTLLAADDAGIQIRAATGGEMQVLFADVLETKVMPPW
jgi:ribosome maturation factor RimP